MPNDAGRERARRDAVRDATDARVGPHRAVRPARGTRHVPRPWTEPGAAAGGASRSRVQSVLTALPVLMLVAGFWVHYRGERAQSVGAPIRAESVEVEGRFEGFSTVRSGGEGQHYLWFDDGGRRRGARLRAAQREALGALEGGDAIVLGLAPTVAGSTTLWVWYVAREDGGASGTGETVLVDESGRLR